MTKIPHDIQAQHDLLLETIKENIRLQRIYGCLLIKMAHIQQGILSTQEISELMSKPNAKVFKEHVAVEFSNKYKGRRARALMCTYHLMGVDYRTIARFMAYQPHVVRKYLKRFQRGEYELLLHTPKRTEKIKNPKIRDELFALVHTPPREFNINRTTWTIELMREVLAEKGIKVGKNNISKILKSEGFVFRKTREVLTSNDPAYKEKLRKITYTLRHLGPADRFFSIDEYGPVSVKERGGRRRVLRGEKPVVPQYQDSKGFLIMTAALELCTNQITHFYSEKKDTEEMIKLLYLLMARYWDCRRLYLSWDAASWHSSKKFLAEVKKVNSYEYRNSHQTPYVKLAPLPARAQFLNVIESVFSGLSQSVLHNSNYESVLEAKNAIDRYVNERNAYFRKNPRKAGNKIWGKEQVPSYFSVSHNCKHPRAMGLHSFR